jgi:lysine 2,3-aminomutase
MESEALLNEEFEPPGCFGELAGGEDHAGFLPARPMRTEFSRAAAAKALRCAEGSRTREFHRRCFPGVTSRQWHDWQWQFQNRIRDTETLSRVISLSEAEQQALSAPGGALPFAITPYYASLLDKGDPGQPIRRTVVPVIDEHLRTPGEANDPLNEEQASPVPGIVHRYPDRVLFLVTGICATHCRYCTRSRLVGSSVRGIGAAHWEGAITYIAAHREIRDVLLSGGDPLTLPDGHLAWLLSKLAAIPHVEMLRIGTKAPVVMPQRITPALVRMLRRYHPLWMSIHVTHPDELTPEMMRACTRLADAGIPLGSQTVLLAGINDEIETMKRLVHGLVRIRVRPYYLYQCDPIPGSSHFRTPVARGLRIIEGLQGHTTGYAVPTYVVDTPGGGGKVPLLPPYALGREDGDLLLKNFEGRIYRYPDGEGTSPGVH